MKLLKKLIYLSIILHLISSVLLPLTAKAEGMDGDLPWWKKHNEGWYFYNEKIPQQIPQEEPDYHDEKENSIASSKEEKELFTDMLEKKGKELLSKAIENPTIENVKTYMEFNKLQMQLSSNFALAWVRALSMYPELAVDIPLSDADKLIYYEEEKRIQDEKIRKLASFAGLLFFYSTTCPYCQRQAYYLVEFKKKHPEMVIKPISIDGGFLPEFPDTVVDNGISQTLEVSTVPALFLAYPPEKFDRIATGIISITDIEKVLVQYYDFYMQGISPADRHLYLSGTDSVLTGK